ncbi:MAG: putative phosphoribosyl transferase [Chloroflexia bacterium]|jgi:predicted phosphoribosyltransferase|nr:putative phosphoribosyl transferase [Chloroflexia bacterium]
MNDSVTLAPFNDRTDAGRQLALDLPRFLHGQDPIILALPMGGVPAAAAVANELNLPLDLVVSRRIPAPGGLGLSGEDSVGAVTPDRTLVINTELVKQVGLTGEQVEQLSIPVWSDAQRRQQLYRRGRPYPDLRGKMAVIIDDGLTTGYTMMAAVISVRKLEPARILVAVPVASIEAIERLGTYVDELHAVRISYEDPFAVASYYKYYVPLTDQDVIWTMDYFWDQHPLQGYSETF